MSPRQEVGPHRPRPASPRQAGGDLPQYLTTREVADLMRVKERKVYDLAAAGAIPHRRATGKLLFPLAEITAWIEGGERSAPAARPPVLAGSHDPLLDWAVRESACGLSSLYEGSADGLERFRLGRAALCGLHVPEDGGWNVAAVASQGLRDCVLISWAARWQGLILAQGAAGTVRSLADLAGRRVALRQPGAGARALFDRLWAQAGLDPAVLVAAPGVARTESDLAVAIASGAAEAGIGLQSMARQFRLDFVPLTEERFDLLVDRRSWFTTPLQTLMSFTASAAFREHAQALGGYDVSETGQVRWLSP